MRVELNKQTFIIIGALALGAFIFPSLLVMAAVVVGWMIIENWLSPPVQEGVPPPSACRLTVTAENPEWKRPFLDFCGSPAETAFLEAMISAYGLLPESGVLKGGKLSLDMQVQVKPYRVDFLADDWLVVEIDGAAYHSSPEAVANDRIRDQFLQENGYSVLRIPAKIVFVAPEEAVRYVRSAIAVGRRPQSVATKPDCPAPNWSLGQTLKSFGQALTAASNAIGDANSYVETARAVQEATSQSRATFNLEMKVVDMSIESALSNIKVDEFRSKSESHKNHYDESYKLFENILRDDPQFGAFTMSIPQITIPKSHPDPKIDEQIKSAHQNLMDERSKYFREIGQRMKVNHQLRKSVKSRLNEIGCSKCWDAISP